MEGWLKLFLSVERRRIEKRGKLYFEEKTFLAVARFEFRPFLEKDTLCVECLYLERSFPDTLFAIFGRTNWIGSLCNCDYPNFNSTRKNIWNPRQPIIYMDIRMLPETTENRTWTWLSFSAPSSLCWFWKPRRLKLHIWGRARLRKAYTAGTANWLNCPECLATLITIKETGKRPPRECSGRRQNQNFSVRASKICHCDILSRDTFVMCCVCLYCALCNDWWYFFVWDQNKKGSYFDGIWTGFKLTSTITKWVFTQNIIES